MPPDLPNLDCQVQYVESLRPGMSRALLAGGAVHKWLEFLHTSAEVIESTADEQGQPVLIAQAKLYYLAAWPDDEALLRILTSLCTNAQIATTRLPAGVRRRDTASHQFWFNYGSQSVEFAGVTIPAAGVHWQAV